MWRRLVSPKVSQYARSNLSCRHFRSRRHFAGRRWIHTSTALAFKGRLGLGLGRGDEEFYLAQQRLRAMDPDRQIDPAMAVILKSLYRQAMEGNQKTPHEKSHIGPLVYNVMNDAADLLKGVTKEGARGEYIRIVTQLWENSDENGEARPYRRGTLGDGRAMFAERREQLQVSGSDAYIVGSTSSNTGEKFLHEEIDDGVQMIWFNHTVRDNSLTLDMLRTLPRLLQKAADDEDVFATVLTGEGETFCTGLDKDMLASVLQKPGESKADWEARMFEYRTAIEEYVASFITCSKPLIAAVNGSAVGLGATTLALCDLVFASTMITLHVPDQQLGMSALGCASYTFPRMMGNSVAADMLLRGARHLVRDSQRHGIVTFVMDDTEASHVLERVLYLMSTLPMQTLLSSRQLMKSYDREMLLAVNKGECDTLVERWRSREGQEGIKRFLACKPIQLIPQTIITPEAQDSGSPFAIPGIFKAEKSSKKLPAEEEEEEKDTLPAQAS